MRNTMKKSTKLLLTQLLAQMLLTQTALSATLNIIIADDKANKISDAVVYLQPTDGRKLAVPTKNEMVDQVNKQFLPKIKVISKNSQVSFPNKDNIHHHLYSFSKAKQFEIPLYKGKPSQSIVFDKVGVVKLGCNIHDWMKGYVFVVDTPFYTQTNNQGKARISKVSKGQYSVNIWHPHAKKTIRFPLKVDSNNQSFNLQKTLNLKKVIERRHTPRRRDGHY